MGLLFQNYKSRYPLETLLANYLFNIYNDQKDEMLNDFFEDDQNIFYNHFGKYKEEILDMIYNFDRYTEYKLDCFDMSCMEENEQKEELKKELLRKEKPIFQNLMKSINTTCNLLMEINQEETLKFIESVKNHLKDYWVSIPNMDEYFNLLDYDKVMKGK